MVEVSTATFQNSPVGDLLIAQQSYPLLWRSGWWNCMSGMRMESNSSLKWLWRMWVQCERRICGLTIWSWHLPLWVHSHVRHLGLQPCGSLAELLPECLYWKSILLLFTYWFVVAAPAALLLFQQQNTDQYRKPPRRRSARPFSCLSHSLSFFSLCVQQKTQESSFVCVNRQSAAPLCFSAHWVYRGWKPFPAIS